MRPTRSIQRRLLGDQVVLILLLGGALMATTFYGAGQAIQTVSQEVIARSLDQAETELQRFFAPVTAALEAMRSWDQAGLLPDLDRESLRRLALPVVENLPQLSGVLLADDDGGQMFLARREGQWRELLGAGEGGESAGDADSARYADYDARTRPWFQGAVSVATPGDVHWTEPYAFFGRQLKGMTAALAYPLADGRTRVAALDVGLEDLWKYARGIAVSEAGSLWIATEERRLVAWPDDPALWGSRDPAEALLQIPAELDLQLVDDATELLRGRTAKALAAPTRFASGGQRWWAAGRRFELSSERALMMIVMVPQSDLLPDRAQLRWWILGVTLAVLAGAVGRAFVLSRRFSEPIQALARESDRISQGDLEPGDPIESELVEVQRLADAHERMRGGLETLVKLEGDLQVARMIQQKTFPVELPGLTGFDIVGWSQPADETGGDSYDVIGLDAGGSLTDGDAERLVLMLADATGHGVGPALSVTQLRAMLRMAVRIGGDLADTAAQINEQLYSDLPQNRFITAWMGSLEKDGSLTSFSGGQAPLLVYRAATDEVEVLGADAPPLGLLPPMPVRIKPPLTLLPGDVYVALSDGFYEASDATGEEFEKERVIAVLKERHHLGAEEILAGLREAVEVFTGGAPLDDDRTAVILRRV
jgi:serine phosphatase RsbU (regulator of sigma subunit)